MPEEKQIKKINCESLLKSIAIVMVSLAIVVLIFGAGMLVGETKARFSYKWAESYHKNFAGPRGGFFGDWRKPPPLPAHGDFIEGHGSFGEIIELNDNSFVMKGRGDIEKIIMTTPETIIKKGMETVKEGPQVGDQAVVIGVPNELGQIEAKLIRIFNNF